MIDWLPFCVRRDGPPSKAGYPQFPVAIPMRGEVKHSAEGGWDGAHAVLDDLNRRSSWHFTIGYDRVEQHYSLASKCWHAGDVGDDQGVRANLELWGTEHLGVAGEPLTDYQVAATVKLTQALMREAGLATAHRSTAYGAFALPEHKEVSDLPTACPSGRIPWGVIMPQLGGDEMFVRFNGRASFFDGKEYPPGDYEMRLDVDFPGLPLTAKAVELDVRIDSTYLGRLQMRDGAGAYADELNRHKPQAIVKVIPQVGQLQTGGFANRVRFKVLDKPIRFTNVGIVGFWS